MPTRSAAAPAAEPGVDAAAFAALDRRLDRGSKAPVALALSGGGDSVALLHLAARWAAQAGRPLLALTIDHELHPDSAAWTATAAQTAAAAGADWRGLAWRGEKPSAGLPAAARSARHRLLADAARAAGASVLLVGHTADDVLEGEAMRAGDAPTLGVLREWSPSPVWPEGRGLFLARPLLSLRRAVLREWLAQHGLSWIEDPANADLRYARPRARRFLAGGGAAPEPLSDAPLSLDGVEATADGRLLIPRGLFRETGGRRLLAAALLCASGEERPPRGPALERLHERLSGAGPVVATLAGARASAKGEVAEIGREAGERLRGGLAPVPLETGRADVWDGRFEILALEPGWTAVPLGGRIGELPKPERQAVRSYPAAARGALPGLVGPSGEVRLARPFGSGPAIARELATARFAGACGLVARETEIDSAPHGAGRFVTLSSGPRT